MKPTLPANKPNRFDVKLTHKPRPMYPVHAQGKGWSLSLIMIPMEVIRSLMGFKAARKNLQIWVNNLGPALYNPNGWKIKDNKIIWWGTHRLRALEALDFNFVYMYQAIGNVPSIISDEETKKKKLNNREPTQLRLHPVPCEKCGKLVSRWKPKRPKSLNLRCYKCESCGHEFVTEVVYPEPV